MRANSDGKGNGSMDWNSFIQSKYLRGGLCALLIAAILLGLWLPGTGLKEAQPDDPLQGESVREITALKLGENEQLNTVSVPDGDTAFMAVSIGMGIFVASHLCDGFAVRHGVESVDLQCDLDNVVMGIAWKAGSNNIDAFVNSASKLFEGKEKDAPISNARIYASDVD